MNTSLSDHQLEKLNKDGFLVLNDMISAEDLERSRAEFDKIFSLAKSREYNLVRDDHQLSADGIYGIELPFHPKIYSKDIFSAVVKSKCLDLCNSALGTENTFLALNRYHLSFEHTWSGVWHRDGDIGKHDTVQIIFPFYDEVGLHLIPGSQNFSVEGFTPQDPGRAKYPEEVVLNLKVGQVLLFRSSILHRGTCIGGYNGMKRAHLHLRVAKIETLNEHSRYEEESFWRREEVLSVADETWKKILTQELPKPNEYAQPATGTRRSGLKFSIKVTVNRLLHSLFSSLPEDHLIFKKLKFLRPKLTEKKIRKNFNVISLERP